MTFETSPVVGALVAAIPTPEPADSPALRILIADETALIREGLKITLKLLGRPCDVIEADNWPQVIDHCQSASPPHLVLIDEDLMPSPEDEQLALLRAHQTELRVVVVANQESGSRMREALRHGVNGYISKKAGSRLLINALQLVLDGGTYVSPQALLMAEPVSELRRPAGTAMSGGVLMRSDLSARLTARQMEVLAQLTKGHSNKLICRELGMAMGTVKSHIAAIFSALQVSSRTAAVAAVTRIDLPRRDAPPVTSWRAQNF